MSSAARPVQSPLFLLGVFLLAGCSASGSSEAPAAAAPPVEASSLNLSSPAFEPGGEIPRRFTCEGGDHSPPLRWSGVPDGTAAFALLVDDPDAPDPAHPRRTWVHWVLYDLPGDSRELPEDAARGSLPAGTRVGTNDWKKTAYGGPCPPIGRHRYFHRLYALDAPLGDLGAPTESELLSAMEGHVLARAELVGTYQKTGKGD